jgi:predicted CopG family antitoxin
MSEQLLIEVPVTQTVFNQLLQFAKAEDRSVSEIIEDLVLDYERREAMRRSAEAMRRLQEEAVRNGTAGMTMDEVNEEIAAARKDMANPWQSA